MKIIKLTITIALLFLVDIALFSCSSKDDGAPVDPPTIKVKSVSLNKTANTKIVGETMQLTAIIKPSDATNRADECTATTAYMLMETDKNKVSLLIDAAEADRPDCWIDLNNNFQRDKDENIAFAQKKAYSPTTKIITIYGKVKTLGAFNNQLTELDVSNNIYLDTIECYGNRLTKLNLNNNTKLLYIRCFDNNLTELNLDKNINLIKISCGYNKLTKLDVSKNTKLDSIWCGSNQLTKLNLGKKTNPRDIRCGNNKLTELDLSNNTNLKEIQCYFNQLTNLNLSNNKKLKWISCYKNRLSELDVSNNKKLEVLRCNENNLTKLDLSKNTKLKDIDFSENKLLKSLNLANGKNASVIKWLKVTDCPNLSCIQIDKGFTPNKNWHKDLAAKWNNTGNPCK